MHFSSFRHVILALPLLAGCAASTDAPSDGRGEDGVGETTEAATGRPNYTRRNTSLLGNWNGNDYCPGGFDLCTDARVQKEANGTWSITLGPSEYGSNLTLPLTPANGVFVFTTGDGNGVEGYDDCQDPGCGDVMKVSGVLYAKKVGAKWVPTLKFSLTFEFAYPEEEGDPNGEVKHTSYLTKAQ